MFSEFSSTHCQYHAPRRTNVKVPLTIRDTVEVVVGLGGAEVNTNKLIINLILDIREENESRDNAATTASLHAGLDVAVPQVRRGRQHGAHAALGHGQQHIAVVQRRLARRHPVGLGRVAEVFANVGDVVEGIELEVLVLARGRGDAGVEGEGCCGIAAAETEGTDTALAVFYTGKG